MSGSNTLNNIMAMHNAKQQVQAQPFQQSVSLPKSDFRICLALWRAPATTAQFRGTTRVKPVCHDGPAGNVPAPNDAPATANGFWRSPIEPLCIYPTPERIWPDEYGHGEYESIFESIRRSSTSSTTATTLNG